MIKEISVQDLKKKLDAKEDFQLIDVREMAEREICSIGGELIPLGSLLENPDKILADKEVVIYCKSGGRSGHAVQALQQKLSHPRLFNLKGGILAWAREIDPSCKIY